MKVKVCGPRSGGEGRRAALLYVAHGSIADMCAERQSLCVQVATDSMKEISSCDMGCALGWGWAGAISFATIS